MTDPADYLPLIRKTARRYCCIEDAEQEAWLCYCEAMNDFDERRNVKFSTFLMLRLRVHFKKLLREKQKRQRLRAAVKNDMKLSARMNRQIDNADNLQKIDLEQLPPRTREAVRHVLAGRTLTQTARIMRITPQGVRNLLRRAGRVMV